VERLGCDGFSGGRFFGKNHGFREKGCRDRKAVGMPEHAFFAVRLIEFPWKEANRADQARKKITESANC
jgi:hypothetical protein